MLSHLVGICVMGSPDEFIGCQSLFCLLHFLSWSFSLDLYCSKRTAQNFRTFAAASIPVVLHLSRQDKFWSQKAELALVTLPLQAVLADWSWEWEAYLTRGNLLLCRHNIHIQICSPSVLGVLSPSALSLVFISSFPAEGSFLGATSYQIPAETRHAVPVQIHSA